MYRIALLLIAFFTIMILSAQPGSQTEVLTVESYQAFQGYEETTPYLGIGEYQIFYDNIDGVFDKPFVLVEGFDPGDNNTISSIYSYLTYNAGANNLLEDLRDEGLDIVILNFPTYNRSEDGLEVDGGSDYIERNGLVLVNLLETLKQDLPANNDMTVMGISMGGLISLYALSFMEQNGMDHKTGLWFSFDSPHRGANIPISFQYLVNYIAEENEDENMIALRDEQLNSPAAKQMLLDHYSSHLQAGSTTAQDTSIQLPTPAVTFRDNFVNTMETLGFPQNTRKLAICNGSLNNTQVDEPGAQIIETTLGLGGGVSAEIILHFTPSAGVNDYQVVEINLTWVGIPIGGYDTFATSPGTTSGLDTAPGGTVLIADFLGNSEDPTFQQIINDLDAEAFSFIPAMSSLAIETDNWYQSVTTSTTTSFDDYIGIDINEPHVTLNAQNLAFILQEISNHYLANPNITFSNTITLLGNPATNNIRLKTLENLTESYEIKLFDMQGLLVFNRNLVPENQLISIEAPATKGMYILQVSCQQDTMIQKILIK
jgi:hypothetical protein